jgi:hypothetical protein
MPDIPVALAACTTDIVVAKSAIVATTEKLALKVATTSSWRPTARDARFWLA